MDQARLIAQELNRLEPSQVNPKYIAAIRYFHAVDDWSYIRGPDMAFLDGDPRFATIV